MYVHHGSDETVEVGSDLYEIDTEAKATVQDSKGSTPASLPEAAPASSPAPAVLSSHVQAKATDQTRVPSIHFLGKDGWKTKLAGVPVLPPVPTNYGRPIFTEEEMEALLTGGANLAPGVKQHSTGATFGY
jgi:hypothetical protein